MSVLLLGLLVVGQCGGGGCCPVHPCPGSVGGSCYSGHCPATAPAVKPPTPAQYASNILWLVRTEKAELRVKTDEWRQEEDEDAKADLRKECGILRAKIDAMQDWLVSYHRHQHNHK